MKRKTHYRLSLTIAFEKVGLTYPRGGLFVIASTKSCRIQVHTHARTHARMHARTCPGRLRAGTMCERCPNKKKSPTLSHTVMCLHMRRGTWYTSTCAVCPHVDTAQEQEELLLLVYGTRVPLPMDNTCSRDRTFPPDDTVGMPRTSDHLVSGELDTTHARDRLLCAIVSSR